MHHPTTRQATRTTHRTQKSSLSPYVLDDVAFTLSDIRRARDHLEAPIPWGGDVRLYLPRRRRSTLLENPTAAIPAE